jgi:hypothetical protein
MVGLSSLGFYLFLAVWVAAVIWKRTQEKIAVQETLRKCIDSGTVITPEVVDALRRTKPRRPESEIRQSATRFRYWGLFLAILGIALTLWGSQYSSKPFVGIVFFLVPGLFCLAHSFITFRTQLPPKQ